MSIINTGISAIADPRKVLYDTAERFTRLADNPDLTPQFGNQSMQTHAATAARAYRKLALDGVPGFDPVFKIGPTGPSLMGDHEGLWAMVWKTIARVEALRIGRDMMTIGQYSWTIRSRSETTPHATAVSTGVGSAPPELWRERAHDYAAVCRSLADRAEADAEQWIPSGVAARRSRLDTSTIRKRAMAEDWPLRKSGRAFSYRLSDLEAAWTDRDFRTDPPSGK